MKGLESANQFYQEALLPKLKIEFPNIFDKIFICKKGRGSECYGFDDIISQDHDFSPSVQIVLTEKQDREFGFKLMRFYHQFEKERVQSLYKERRDGIFSLPEFLESLIGSSTPPESPIDFLQIPEYALYEANNGMVFQDGDGEVLEAVNKLKNIPLDVFRQRLAAHLTLAYQSGVYNAERMLKRGDEEGYLFCINQYIEHLSSALFALNISSAPYYKWRFKALHQLENGNDISKLLSELLLNKKSDKIALITEINTKLLYLLQTLSFTTSLSPSLELAALQVKEKIEDKRVKALHIMTY